MRYGPRQHVVTLAVTPIDVRSAHALPVVGIVISPLAHTTFWTLVLLLCLLNATVLFILASLYANCVVPGTIMTFLVTDSLRHPYDAFVQEHHVLIVVVYAALGALYLYPPTTMIWLSFRERRLVFQTEPAATHHHRSSICTRLIHKIQGAFHSVHVLGSHFPHFMFAVELFEIAMQTVQGYRCSTNVSNVTLNLMYGALICVNCCSTPMIHYIWERRKWHEVLGRLVCVMVDGILDFAWGVGFQSYTLIEARELIEIDFEGSSDELMTAMIEQTLVVSFTNLAFTAVPFITSLLVIGELREALMQAHIVSQKFQSSAGYKDQHQTTISKVFEQRVRAPRHTVKRLHMMLGMYGFAILFLSMASVGLFSPIPQHSRCSSIVFPWGRPPVCVHHYINCTDREIAGHREEMAAVFAEVVPSMTHTIEIYGCPELEMPTSHGPLIKLEDLVIIESIVVDWSEDAAIAKMAPQLHSLILFDVSFECVPTGLAQQPKSVSRLMFANLQTVDVDLIFDTITIDWTSITDFMCFACNLTSIPSIVLEMTNLAQAEFDDNFIEFLPEDKLRQKDALTYLSLVGNPINDLPATLWNYLPALTYLHMDYTNISSVPRLEPIVLRQSPVVSAFSTPLCDDNTVSDFEWPVVYCK